MTEKSTGSPAGCDAWSCLGSQAEVQKGKHVVIPCL